MRIINAKCPCCGNAFPTSEAELANLSKPKLFCRYCGKEIILEAAVAYAESVSRTTLHPKNPDFVIYAGELVEYKGESGRVVIPSGVVSIGASAFEGTLIRSVYIPKSVRRIQDNAFKDCVCLDSVNIPKSVMHVSRTAFEGTPYKWRKDGLCPFCGGELSWGLFSPKRCLDCRRRPEEYKVHDDYAPSKG